MSTPPPQESPEQGHPQPGYQPRDYPQPGYSQPGYSEPGYSEPGYSEPGYSEPGYSEPGYSEPGYSEPGYSQPGYPPHGYQHQDYPRPGYPPQGDPLQGYPQQGYPQGYPRQGGPPQQGADDPTSVVGQRFAQGVLDYLLVLVPFMVLYFGSIVLSIAAYSASSDFGAIGTLVSLVSTLAWLLVPAGMWFVYAWWPHKHNGQTFAMKWLKLRIVDEHGGVPTLKALTLRTVLFIADGFFFGVVGLVVMSTNPRHQRLGDRVAKTLVIRTS
jgi:uncharacterized RDD family membrane protein YckC